MSKAQMLPPKKVHFKGYLNRWSYAYTARSLCMHSHSLRNPLFSMHSVFLHTHTQPLTCMCSAYTAARVQMHMQRECREPNANLWVWSCVLWITSMSHWFYFTHWVRRALCLCVSVYICEAHTAVIVWCVAGERCAPMRFSCAVPIHQLSARGTGLSLNVNHCFQWLINSGWLIIPTPSPPLLLSSPHSSPSS